jgi:hypothetical protein
VPAVVCAGEQAGVAVLTPGLAGVSTAGSYTTVPSSVMAIRASDPP